MIDIELLNKIENEKLKLHEIIYPNGYYNSEAMEKAENNGDYSRYCKLENLSNDIYNYIRRKKVANWIKERGYLPITRAEFVRTLLNSDTCEYFYNGEKVGVRKQWEKHSNFICGRTGNGEKTYLYYSPKDKYFKNSNGNLCYNSVYNVIEYKF